MTLPAELRLSGDSIDPAQIRERLDRIPDVRRYWLGLSGGLDSCVLLHLLSRAKPAAGFKAIHINHGLRPAAQQWAQTCVDLCVRYGVEIEVLQVDAKPAAGESPEAAARNARYAAIEKRLQPGDCLLTAHHQDDQAETLLLQLLRGSGPAGLAAMPELAPFGCGWHMRPLLSLDRKTLQDYASAVGLQWIEDDSNSDERYDRNFLRAQVMPLLATRWPALSRTLARAAAHQAEALELMQALAQLDYLRLYNPLSATVSVAALKTLALPRQRNVLRHWLGLNAVLSPSTAVLQQIMDALDAGIDRLPVIAWDRWEVRRYQDQLYLLDRNKPEPAQEYIWRLADGHLPIPELQLELSLPQLLAAGLQLPAATECLYIRFRAGGERMTLAGRGHSHSLKKLLQQQRVPPWLRSRLPMLYDTQGRLLAVLGLEPPLLAAVSAED